MNFEDVQFDANASSLKLLASGTGTLSTAAGTSADVTATIPHGYGSDKLLWQVAITNGQTGQTYVTPLITSNGAYRLQSFMNSTNLLINVWFSVGAANPAITWTYTYRILIP